MVRKYTKKDWKEVSSWFQERNIPFTEDLLPEHGFIIPGIAAGYLYATDSNFCIFEGFVANPKADRNSRKEGLRLIVTELIKQAKELEFKQVFGFAASKTMIKIGFEQGFKLVETCSTIVRKLE